MSSALHARAPRRLAFVTALIACLGSTTGAHAAITANISFSDLRFTLVDLTPDDGIGPSASFNQGGAAIRTASNLGAEATDGSTLPAGLPVSLPQLSAEGGFGAASLGATGGSFTASLGSAGDVATNAGSTSDISWFGSAHAIGGVGYQAGMETPGGRIVPGQDGYQFTITLGAHTGITLDTSYTSTLKLSPQQVLEVLDLTVSQADPTRTVSYTSYAGWASTTLLGIMSTGGIFSDDPNTAFMVGGDGQTFGNQTPCDPCDLSEQVSQQSAALSMTYQNTTGSALDVSFLLIAEATVSQGANVLYFPQPDVPVIPEPGTWALMGLGLLGLGWARRRTTPSPI